MPAAPLIVWVSRNSESTASASALPFSSASSVSTMRSSRSRASSRKISRNSVSGSVMPPALRATREEPIDVDDPDELPVLQDRAAEVLGLRLLGRRPRAATTSVTSSTASPASRPACSVTTMRGAGASPAIASTRARSNTGSTWPCRLRTPSTDGAGAGHGAQLAELGDLEHVLDRQRVALAADPQPHVDARSSQRRLERAPRRGVAVLRGVLAASARDPRRARRPAAR